jgi:hypothetical protein
MKDILESKIDRIKRRHVRESIKGLAKLRFPIPHEWYYFVHEGLIEYAAWPPDKETGIYDALDILG